MYSAYRHCSRTYFASLFTSLLILISLFILLHSFPFVYRFTAPSPSYLFVFLLTLYLFFLLFLLFIIAILVFLLLVVKFLLLIFLCYSIYLCCLRNITKSSNYLTFFVYLFRSSSFPAFDHQSSFTSYIFLSS